jgi:hypothetical protein
MNTEQILPPGADFREPRFRKEVFLRFYSFHLKYRTHPGCVYFALPYVAEKLGWDLEQRLWAAFLNGNTQNPVTTLLLMEQGSRPQESEAVLAFWRANFKQLQWDTDRRHHKSKLHEAVASYRLLTGDHQERYWRNSVLMDGWASCWKWARAIWSFGRLSAWSYLEYVRLLARPGIAMPDAASLLLEDIDGSQSHRNGLCLVSGEDGWLWDKTLAPGATAAVYTRERVQALERFGAELLQEAQARNPGHPDVGYLTLESALCTYKSWHKPNRRYPNVYADMLHDRLVWAQERWGARFDVLWQARQDCLPWYLRVEDNPKDPGLCPEKQNFYLEHGCPVMMSYDEPVFQNAFDNRIWEPA